MEGSLAEQDPTQSNQTAEQNPTQSVPANRPKTDPIHLIISNDKAQGNATSHYNVMLPTDGKLYSFAFGKGGSTALFPNAQFPNANTVVATSIQFNSTKYVLGLAGDGFRGTDGGIQAGPPFKLQTNGDAVDISKWTVMANPKF